LETLFPKTEILNVKLYYKLKYDKDLQIKMYSQETLLYFLHENQLNTESTFTNLTNCTLTYN